jgi:hypothetical protein
MTHSATLISALTAVLAAVGCSSSSIGTNDVSRGSTSAGMDAGAIVADATASDSSNASTTPDDAQFVIPGPPSFIVDGEVPSSHRPEPVSCPSQRGPGPSGQPYSHNSCASDSDCTAGTNGRCFPGAGLAGAGGCSYDQCDVDSDCGTKTPCDCRSSPSDNAANVCAQGSNCAVDSDCGPGGYCSAAPGCGGAPTQYFCHTASDTCVNDSDCPPVSAGAGCATSTVCGYDGQAQRWACSQLTCCPP